MTYDFSPNKIIKSVIAIDFFLLVVISLMPLQVKSSSNQYALVYRGPGTCPGCPEAAAEVASQLQLPIRYVEPGGLTDNTFANAAVYIQAGGDDSLDIKKALSNQEILALKKYIASGGRYWGLCAGAYFAGQTLDDRGKVEGLKIVPGDAEPYKRSHEALLETVNWQGQARQMYLQDAPRFRLLRNAKIVPIAYYRDGSIAAFMSNYYQGKVAVSGPHPEADYTWFDKDGLTPPAILSHDLAIKMLNDLLQ